MREAVPVSPKAAWAIARCMDSMVPLRSRNAVRFRCGTEAIKIGSSTEPPHATCPGARQADPVGDPTFSINALDNHKLFAVGSNQAANTAALFRALLAIGSDPVPATVARSIAPCDLDDRVFPAILDALERLFSAGPPSVPPRTRSPHPPRAPR